VGTGTKTSVGRAAGVTIRATVCFVPLHVAKVASTATAAASNRIEDQRRERFIGDSVVAREVYPENRPRRKKGASAGWHEAPSKSAGARDGAERTC
jgi:hypothetical protein